MGKLHTVKQGVLVKVSKDNFVERYELDELIIENEINKFRESNGLNTLERYDPLCDLAKVRVYEIKTDWSHDGFEKRSEDIYTRFCNRDPIVCTHAGENLAKGTFENEMDLIDGWANSEGHRENMLSNYNVQCVAASENHYVSLFAYTEDLDEIKKKQNEVLQKKVVYNYEKVIFWEQQRIDNEKYKNNWKSGLDNPHYNNSDVEELLDIFDEKINLAYKLWDGYTNSKISYANANDMENRYWNLANKSANLSKKLNMDAYDNCLEDDVEKSFCENYKN